MPLGGGNLDGFLRVAQRVFETVLLFIDSRTGVV